MSTTTTILENRFQVEFDNPSSFIGQGGMGTVYRGLDKQTQTPVAIKILKNDLVQRDPELIKRFRLEGETLRQLNHPNIVKMLGSEELDGINYLVMEYVSGGSLRDVLDESPTLSVQRSLYIALDLADALTRAHRLQVLHRDIKPGNVLVADDGTPRLTDFGMARVRGEPQITQDGAIVGTMAYLAPEAFHGEQVDERTDIWAFGILLWEMLVGERPFPQDKPAPLIQAIVTDALPDLEKTRPDIPTALVDLLYRMLDKNRQSRIPSARLIGAELETIIRGGSSTLQPVVSVSDSTGRFDLDTTEFPVAGNGQQFVAANNLQHQPTPFVGREDELHNLIEMVTNGASLISLTGPGGIGKSRIALALAENSLSYFEDGVYAISLDAVDKASNVAGTIGEAIGFTFSGGNPQGELSNYLREKHMLLVLDNFETVMDATNLIAELVSNAAKLTLIVTSRERLRLRGEQVFDVDAMKIPAKRDEAPDLLAKFPVIKLFMQSAKRVMPGFELDEAAACDVAEIVRLVGGLPLGVELAAGWLEMLPLHEIVREIEKSLDFLETDLKDVPERHRSLRSVADYSWNLLAEEEREVFLKLSVFRSGFEREAAQKVAGASLRNLTNLVNKSLLIREPQGRYHVHKLLRQYGEERFKDHPDAMPTHMAFADYYITLVTKLQAVIQSSKEDAAFEALDKEIGNIRHLWRMGQEFEKFEKVDLLQETLFYYYLGRAMLNEGLELFKGLADKMESVGQKNAIYWRARSRQGLFLARLGHYEDAIKLAEAALNAFPDDAEHDRAMAYLLIGNIMMFQGDYVASTEILEKGRDLLNDKTVWYYPALRSSLGYVKYLMGDLRAARDIYENLLQTSEGQDYPTTVLANLKNNTGEVLQRLGDYTRAMTLYQESLELSKSPHNPRQIAVAKLNIAGLYFQQSDYQKAGELFQESYDLYREMGDRWGIAQALSNLGNVAMSAGDHEAAHIKYKSALTIRREMGEKRGIADSLSDLAFCAMTQGAMDISQQYTKEALEIRREIGDRLGEGSALSYYGFTALLSGRFDEAKEFFDASKLIGEETGSSMILAQVYTGLGQVALGNGDYETAMRYFKMVLRENNVGEAPLPMVLWALLGVATIKVERGEHVSALQMVTLILRYPKNFINFVEKHAAELLDKLTMMMDEQDVQSTTTATKSLILRNFIEELLAE